jgi:hypothetical protein
VHAENHAGSPTPKTKGFKATDTEGYITLEPPQLEGLALLHHNFIQRSSTFREFLEQAADNINHKYDTISERSDVPAKASDNTVNVVHGLSTHLTPREDSRENSVPSLRNSIELYRDTLKRRGAVYNNHHRNHPSKNLHVHNESSRVPVHWIEKILEQSICLRDPPEAQTTNWKENNIYRDPHGSTPQDQTLLPRSPSVLSERSADALNNADVPQVKLDETGEAEHSHSVRPAEQNPLTCILPIRSKSY